MEDLRASNPSSKPAAFPAVTPEDNAIVPPPTPPAHAEAHGQRAATEQDQKALVAEPSIQQVYLGRADPGGIQAHLAGLAEADSRTMLNRFGASAFYTILNTMEKRIAELTDDVRTERKAKDTAQSALSDMRSRADKAETKLDASDDNNRLRDVTLMLSGAAIGLLPFAYQSGGFIGALIAATFGAVLAIAGFKAKRVRP